MFCGHEFGDSDGDDNKRPKMRNGAELDEIEIVQKENQSDHKQNCSRDECPSKRGK